MVMTKAKIHKGWIKRESFYLTLVGFGRETRKKTAPNVYE